MKKRDKPIGRATGVLDILHWFNLYVSGYPPDVVVVDSIKAGGSRYRKWKWRGRVYYTLRALRAAYQDWQRQQELQATEFFTSLQQYGYKLLDWEPHLPESTSD